MAIDGFGLVAGGENTGAAVHRELPRYGPLDNYVNNLQLQVYQKAQEKQKEKQQLAKTDADIFNLKLEGWDRDRKAELMKMNGAIRNEYAGLRTRGINPNDYTNPEALKFQENLSTLKNAMQTSTQHQAAAKTALDKLQSDNLTDNPTYDYEKSKERFFNEYANLPISERVGKNPEDFFVRKEQPFDSYFLINDKNDKFDIDPFTSKSAFENEEYSSSGNKLNEKELVADITARANNPKYQNQYQAGVDKGLWSNKNEFIKYNVDRAKLLFQPESKYEKKAPKQTAGWTLDIINGTGIDELLNKSGSTPTQYNVPNYNAADGSGRISGDAPKVVKTTLPQSYQLGNINVTIPTAVAIDGISGQPLGEQGLISMTSGLLANALVDTNGKLIPLGDKKNYNFTIGGKKYSGTGDQVKNQMISDGVAQYKPLLFGTVKVKDELGTDQTKSVIVDANSVITGMTNKKGKDPLDDSAAKLAVLNRKSNEMNGTEAQSGTAPQTITRSYIRSLLDNPDYEGYTEQQLIDYFKSQKANIID